MSWSDQLSAIGLLLNVAGSYCLLVASRFWEESYSWPKALRWLGLLFEIDIPRPSLLGLFGLFFGFLLQLIGMIMR
jgi:hypothetical protein